MFIVLMFIAGLALLYLDLRLAALIAWKEDDVDEA